MALADYPTGPKLFLSADNVDGVGNTIAANGTSVQIWKDQGSLGMHFAPLPPGGNSNGTVERMSPLLKTNEVEDLVMFDGSYNLLEGPLSASALAFLHKVGVFDLLLVIRRRATSAFASNRRLFGANVGDVGQRGLLVTLQDPTTVEGAVSVVLAGASGEMASLESTVETAFGAPTKIFIRCDGTRLSITNDFYRYESEALAIPPSSGDGDATNNYFLGGAVANQAYPLLFQGDVGLVALWNRTLSAAEILQLRTALTTQFGVGI